MAQQTLWNLDRKKMLQDRGALPKEEADIVREYKAMHEDNFLSCLLREDVEGKEERRKKTEKSLAEVEKEKGSREDEMVVVKRRCVNPVSGDAFEEFSHVEDSDSCWTAWGDSCGLSECVPEVSSGVPVVIDVPDTRSSLVVMDEALDCGTGVLFFLQKASSFLCGESRKHELRWNAGKSTAELAADS